MEPIPPLQAYLQAHFVPKSRFADIVGISVDRLERLLRLDAIPRATYRSDGRCIESRAFGPIHGHDSVAGEYFRPECARWAKLAAGAAEGAERDTVLGMLAAELASALAAFGYAPAAIEARVRKFIPSFLDGTFGLCVADPSTGAGIVRKEILQERLTELTDNGADPSARGTPRDELLRLIDDYADAAMPFSPAEYPRSSRKRLVDDLRRAIA